MNWGEKTLPRTRYIFYQFIDCVALKNSKTKLNIVLKKVRFEFFLLLLGTAVGNITTSSDLIIYRTVSLLF